MRKFRDIAIVLLIFSLGLTNCSLWPSPDQGGGKIENIHSDKVREKTPQVDKTELTELAAGNMRFAFDLYQSLRETEDNLFYSPYSISLALAMTYAGAREETEKQMAGALHFTLAQQRLHRAFNALDLDFVNRAAASQTQGRQGFQLSIANALWGQQGFDFLDAFLDTLAENYGAGLTLLDFVREWEASRLIINQWVSDQTKEKIKDLLPKDSITKDTRLVLTNAIYFKAAWRFPFDKKETRDGVFHLLDGSQVAVPMMHREIRTGYRKDENCEAFSLPYEDAELSMLILLPQAGKFKECEQSLSYEYLRTIAEHLQDTIVVLTMPKFAYTASINLNKKLAQLGMPVAFTKDANFSGMNGRFDLLITDVVHKAFVSVNEAGTEAAAATAVVVGIESAPPTVTVTIDRPFIFVIHDEKTGTVLFVGRVAHPQK
jgi:serpin B